MNSAHSFTEGYELSPEERRAAELKTQFPDATRQGRKRTVKEEEESDPLFDRRFWRMFFWTWGVCLIITVVAVVGFIICFA